MISLLGSFKKFCLHTRVNRFYATIPRVSQQFIPIQYKAPNDATLISHILLIRAGFIRKHASGMYTLLPLANRVLEKIIKIIDEELQKINCQKIVMPHLLSSDLWEQTGRWQSSGKELIRVKDRHGSNFCLAPTHEECVTNLVAQEALSHRQLPQKLYQIGSKYRDEMFPRYGLLRGREFIMKDLYTFDRTEKEAHETYRQVYDAYKKIFDRCKLNYVIVEADTGNIGGSLSHEFQAISNAGEDEILYCECGKYAANTEKAISKITINGNEKEKSIFVQVVSQNDEICQYQVLMSEGREANPIKIKTYLNAKQVEIINEVNPSILSPKRLIDHSIKEITKIGNEDVIGDWVVAQEGDLCSKQNEIPSCMGSKLKKCRGIELGHVFYLGKKYSSALNCKYGGEDMQLHTIEMGCYGIGVSRLLQAVVQTSNDKDGIIWPFSIAPYRACIIPLVKQNMDEMDEKILKTCENIGEELQKMEEFKGEVIMDDRIVGRPPVKLKDASLIGYPFIIVVGKKFVEEGKIELQIRKTNEKLYFDNIESMIQFIKENIE